MTPRITPGGRAEIGTANWLAIAVGGRIAGTGLPNLFTTMARRRGLLRGWLIFASQLMPRGKLPRRDTELVILRTAARNQCEYELAHHRKIGATAGLTAGEIDRVTDLASDVSTWPTRDLALLTAVDELYADRNLGDETWDALRRHLDEPACIEFLMLAGHYSMLATFINTIGIEVDAH